MVEKSEDDLRSLQEDTAQEDVPQGRNVEMQLDIPEDSPNGGGVTSTDHVGVHDIITDF